MSTRDHHLAAILFTDIVGYTAIMQQDEVQAVQLVKRYLAVLKSSVSAHAGKIINDYGDGSLCSFHSAFEALNCAIELQDKLREEPAIPLRIGLHIGEIFFDNKKIFGDGVNVASRVQSLGIGNSILISSVFHNNIKNHPEYKTVSVGQFHFKNVDEPMEVFALANEGLAVPQRSMMDGKLKKKNNQNIKLFAALLLAVIAVASFFIYKNSLTKNVSTETIDKSIAVLPFVDMSPDHDQEYFSDGLSEELLNLLSKIPELKVIGRTSSFSFKGKNVDLRSIAKKLGVAHVLEGSVRKDGNKIRVTTQLIRASDGSHLWSETYDRELEGIFKIQDDIAGAVVTQLKLKLLTKSVNTASASSNTEVYNLILQGNYFAEKRDKESLAKAMEFYLKALAKDTLSARSWAGVAKCYSMQAEWGGIDRHQGYEKARIASNKAIALDDNQAEGHRILGLIKSFYDYDYRGAEVEFQKALSLEPGNAELLGIVGTLYRITGRFDEGIRVTQQSITLDPVKAVSFFRLGLLFFQANRLEEAIASFKKGLELNPQYPRAHIKLGEAYLLQGKPEMALTEIQQEPDIIFKDYGLALVYHAMGRRKEADEALTNYIARYQNDYAYFIGQIYAFRGEKDKAFEWLEKAYAGKEIWLGMFKSNPILKNLEGDPRHIAFLKKMNFPVD